MVRFYMKVPVITEDNIHFAEGEPVRILATGFGGMLLVESAITRLTLLTGFSAITNEMPKNATGRRLN